QRLFATTIAGQKKRALPLVPYGHGEHAAKPLNAGWPPATIGRQNDLRVTTADKRLAPSLKLGLQLKVIVNLSIIGDRITSRIRGHGLPAEVGQIQDGQSRVPEAHLVFGVDSLPVRAPMVQAVHLRRS